MEQITPVTAQRGLMRVRCYAAFYFEHIGKLATPIANGYAFYNTGRSGLLIAAAFAVALICFCNEPSPDKFDIRWATLILPAVIVFDCMLDSRREPNQWGVSPKYREHND